MKKRFLLIVLVLVMSVVVTSCGGNVDKKDISYSVGIMDYSDNVAMPVEYGEPAKLYDESKYKDIIPAAEKTVTIEGKEITGQYTQTYDRPNNYYPNYMYMANDKGCGFSVDPEGKVVAYIRHGTIDDTGKLFTEEEYIAMAKDFVESLGYEIDWSEFRETVADGYYVGNHYSITFDRYIGEKKTTEYIDFLISYSGIVCGFTADMLGRIPDDLDVTEYNTKAVETAVYKRLDEIYSGMSKETRDKYKIEYHLPEPTISLTADGTPCFIYDAIVCFTPVDGTRGHENLVTVLVTPNK